MFMNALTKGDCIIPAKGGCIAIVDCIVAPYIASLFYSHEIDCWSALIFLTTRLMANDFSDTIALFLFLMQSFAGSC